MMFEIFLTAFPFVRRTLLSVRFRYVRNRTLPYRIHVLPTFPAAQEYNSMDKFVFSYTLTHVAHQQRMPTMCTRRERMTQPCCVYMCARMCGCSGCIRRANCILKTRIGDKRMFSKVMSTKYTNLNCVFSCDLHVDQSTSYARAPTKHVCQPKLDLMESIVAEQSNVFHFRVFRDKNGFTLNLACTMTYTHTHIDRRCHQHSSERYKITLENVYMMSLIVIRN